MPEKTTRPDYKYIGKHVNRTDAPDIVTGKKQFTDDVKIPGMLVGYVLRSPYAHANITSMDMAEARKVPGVKAVLGWEDVPDWMCGFPLHRKVLDKKVRYVGDSVALIAATSLAAAEKAASLIKVEYEPLPTVYDVEESEKEGAPQLYDQYPGNLMPRVSPWSKEPFDHIHRGDVEEGFKNAAFTAEGRFCYDHFPTPVAPDSPGVIALWQTPHELVLHYGGGAPHLQKTYTEDTMPGVSVRIISHTAGGSYGSKQIQPLGCIQAAALAQAAHAPVKLMMDKAEHFNAYETRQGSRMIGKVGVTEDGYINTVEGVWYTDSGMSSTFAQAQTPVGLGEAQTFLGHCENWALDTKLILTNHSCQAPLRGFGGQELKAVLTPMVCTALREGNFDPFEVFKKNFVKKGDKYVWRNNEWWTAEDIDYRGAMDAGAAKFGWHEKWKGWGIPTKVEGSIATGVGIAVHGNADIGEGNSQAYVKLHPMGTVSITACVPETGTNQAHAVKKMVAEILKIPFERVELVECDTQTTPYDEGTVGSRGTITLGTACSRAAKDARRQLLELANKELHIPIEDLDTEDFMIVSKKDPNFRVPWIAVIGTPEITIMGYGLYEQNFQRPNFAAYFAEVQVDLDTGEAKLVYAVISSDVGQIIEPKNLKMQAEGSFGSAGADTALTEELILDKNSGRYVNGNMIDYKWRTFNEFPPFDSVFLESQYTTDNFGAFGFGEIAPAPGPCAIQMAISNAIGNVITEYPATPEVILRAMGKIK